MVSRKNGVGQIIKAFVSGVTLIALSVRFGIIGYQFKPGHPTPSKTYRDGSTALPGHGQLVNL